MHGASNGGSPSTGILKTAHQDLRENSNRPSESWNCEMVVNIFAPSHWQKHHALPVRHYIQRSLKGPSQFHVRANYFFSARSSSTWHDREWWNFKSAEESPTLTSIDSPFAMADFQESDFSSKKLQSSSVITKVTVVK